MTPLNKMIGQNIMHCRRARYLSLDSLAKLSGVSKAMIGQIERGESNPSVNTLWKIAAALQVPFVQLVQESQPATEVIRLHDLAPFANDAGTMQLYHLLSCEQESRYETFLGILASHCRHESVAHAPKSQEYLFVIEGVLEVTVGAESHLLHTNESIRFHADRSHAYYNPGEETARFLNMLYY